MDDALETWITRFAAGAGSQYQWQLTRRGHFAMLRAQVGEEVEDDKPVCPLTAEDLYETSNLTTDASWWVDASQRQGLGIDHARAVVKAADGHEDADPDIRTRLLRICGLTEKN